MDTMIKETICLTQEVKALFDWHREEIIRLKQRIKDLEYEIETLHYEQRENYLVDTLLE